MRDATRIGPLGALVAASRAEVESGTRLSGGAVKPESRLRDLVWRGAGARGVGDDAASGFTPSSCCCLVTATGRFGTLRAFGEDA